MTRFRLPILLTLCGVLLAPIGPITAASGAASPDAAAPIASGAPLAAAVEALCITVGDLDRSIGFYTGALDFDLVDEREIEGAELERLLGVFPLRARVATLRLGEEIIELTQFLAPEGRPIPADARSNDRWFQHAAIVVRDIDEAYLRLREHRVRHASSGPQTLPQWNPGAGGISAFYFKDPDGHVLEIIHFPAGKGDPRWHGQTDRLFLGIDHTAIVVADTERSLALYRDALGLRVAGESENYGIEQERLNAVFGARLRITALRPDRGPGIELLEYLAPTTGREFPGDTAASDLWHWHVRTATTDAERAAHAARRAGGAWISPGVIDLGDRDGALVRDPDGHALLFLQLDSR